MSEMVVCDSNNNSINVSEIKIKQKTKKTEDRSIDAETIEYNHTVAGWFSGVKTKWPSGDVRFNLAEENNKL